MISLVPGAGVEPARPRGHWILSPAWLPLHHPGPGSILHWLAQCTTTRLWVARLNVPRHSPAGRGILPLCRACGRDRESPAHSTSSRAAVWTRPWRSEEPDRPLAPPATVVDNSREPCRPADTFPNPREKPTTRRNQRHVETLVHVVRALRSVISVGVDEDRTVVVDAATKEIREQLIGDGEYGSALRRREAYAEKPVVQIVVVPLNFVKESGRAPNS